MRDLILSEGGILLGGHGGGQPLSTRGVVMVVVMVMVVRVAWW